MPKGFAALPLRVYDDRGHLRATLVDFSDAAAFVAMLGDGAYVSWSPNSPRQYALVWVEGMENWSASQSYDGAAELMIKRVENGTFRTEGELKKWKR